MRGPGWTDKRRRNMGKRKSASRFRGAGDMQDRKKRKCLTCGQLFSSRGPENRICPRHSSLSKRSKYEEAERADPWPGFS